MMDRTFWTCWGLAVACLLFALYAWGRLHGWSLVTP
jgi:hypothetical protein